MSGDPSFNFIRSDFIEKTDLVSQTKGLHRIAGQILGMLTCDDEMVSFSDLARRLQVSRASINTSSVFSKNAVW